MNLEHGFFKGNLGFKGGFFQTLAGIEPTSVMYQQTKTESPTN